MPPDSQNQQDCPTTIHPEGASQLVLVDLILGNRLILTESNPAAGILAGRSLQTDLPLQSPSASRNHCRLKKNEGRWQIEDLDSSNGTWVNGKKVRSADLEPGDILQMGESRFRVEDTINCATPAATHNLLNRLFQDRFEPIHRKNAA